MPTLECVTFFSLPSLKEFIRPGDEHTEWQLSPEGKRQTARLRKEFCTKGGHPLDVIGVILPIAHVYAGDEMYRLMGFGTIYRIQPALPLSDEKRLAELANQYSGKSLRECFLSDPSAEHLLREWAFKRSLEFGRVTGLLEMKCAGIICVAPLFQCLMAEFQGREPELDGPITEALSATFTPQVSHSLESRLATART